MSMKEVRDHRYMHARRGFELAQCFELLLKLRIGVVGTALEIGSGTGFQAILLESRGLSVSAVDVANGSYTSARVYPVQEYDGKLLPFKDEAFDFLFSSNVLEHVSHVPDLLAESNRVMRPGSIAVHVLPTPLWRIWSLLTYYPWVAKKVIALFASKWKRKASMDRVVQVPRSRLEFRKMLFPQRHGEFGNALDEHCWYRTSIWQRRFHDAGFEVISDQPAGLFYTNSALFGPMLSITLRARLSGFLGSACRIYVLRKPSHHRA